MNIYLATHKSPSEKEVIVAVIDFGITEDHVLVFEMYKSDYKKESSKGEIGKYIANNVSQRVPRSTITFLSESSPDVFKYNSSSIW